MQGQNFQAPRGLGGRDSLQNKMSEAVLQQLGQNTSTSGLGTRFQMPDQLLTVMTGHKGVVYQAKFNRNGEYCMSCSSDRNINLWNPHKGTLVKTFSGIHNYEVFDIAIAADNSRFASVGGDKTVFFWDVKTDNILRKFEGHISRVNTVALNDDESVLVSGSYDATVRFWDLKSNTYKPIETIKACRDSVSKVIVNKHEVILSSIDGKVRTYDLRMGLCTTDDMKNPVHSVSLSNDAKTYAASCMDGSIRLVDRERRGEILNSFTGHVVKDYSTAVTHSFDDAFILTGSEDGGIYQYNILEKRPVKVVKNHIKPVVSLDYSQKHSLLIAGSFDNSVSVWKQQSIYE